MDENEFDKNHDITIRMMGTMGVKSQKNSLEREIERYKRHGIAIVSANTSSDHLPNKYSFLSALKEIPGYFWVRNGQRNLYKRFDDREAIEQDRFKGQVLIFAKETIKPEQIPSYAHKMTKEDLYHI